MQTAVPIGRKEVDLLKLIVSVRQAMDNSKGFSTSALKVLDLARREAQMLGHNYIGTEHILLALLGTGPERPNLVLMEFGVNLYDARKEVARISERLWDDPGKALQYSARAQQIMDKLEEFANPSIGQVVYPEHVFYTLLQAEGSTAHKVLDALDVAAIGLQSRLEEMIHAKDPLADRRGGYPTSKALKSFKDWFTPDACQSIQKCVDFASGRKSPLVTTYDFHVILSEEITCIDKGDVNRTRPTPDKQIAAKPEAPINFSPEFLAILVEARKIATPMAVTCNDMFLAFLSLAEQGQLAGVPQLAAESWQNLQFQLINAKKSQREGFEMLPLEADEHTVRTTSRLKRTLLNARKFMKQRHISKIDTSHLVLALIEEAWHSEITFVRREENLNNVQLAIAQLKPDRRKATRDLLKNIIERAVKNAKRLNSRRLDINHLGLALLDENHAAITLVLNTLPGNDDLEKARNILKRRLDQCLIHQTGNEYQTEKGELLDLSDIYGSLEDGST